MRYFVTGATEFIGRAVVRQLIAKGHEVVTVARRPDKYRESVDSGVEVMHGDILEKSTMSEAMLNVDGVFHMTSSYRLHSKDIASKQKLNMELKGNVKAVLHDLREAQEQAKAHGMTVSERHNVVGTRNVLELMKELKIPRGVYTSTLAVFSDTKGRMVHENHRYRGPWNNEFERTKWKAHFEVAQPMIEEKRLPLIILLPGLAYGPGDTGFADEILNAFLRKKLRSIPKKTAFCWTHVDDIAQAHIAAMERGILGESYIVAGPAHTLEQALETAHRLSGVPLPKKRLSPLSLRLSAVLATPATVVRSLPEAYHPEALRTLAGTTSLGASDKARKDLDFEPRSLVEGLRETLAYDMRRLGMIAPPETAEEAKILELKPE